MSVSTDCHIRNLPKRLPAGTVYVVEGCGGHHGKLRVSSRYVVMPSGQRVEIPAELDRTQPVRGPSQAAVWDAMAGQVPDRIVF